jgi:CRP/FNR family transcriptional regulator
MSAPHANCAVCVVRDRALCASLDDDELRALSDIARHRALMRGETLIWAGESGAVCANLVSGVLAMSTSTSDGREQIVGLLFPGDFVGQLFIADATLTFAALTDAELCAYPREAFMALLTDHARLERRLLERTMAALDEARQRMLMLGRRSAGERVAGLLVELGDKLSVGDQSGSVTFELPLRRAQIADVLGLTIETVSRQLTRLKGAGVIALPGGRRVTILDRRGLVARAET